MDSSTSIIYLLHTYCKPRHVQRFQELFIALLNNAVRCRKNVAPKDLQLHRKLLLGTFGGCLIKEQDSPFL